MDEIKPEAQILLNRRNTEAAFNAIKEMDKKIREQQVRIDGLNNTISGFESRLAGVETYIQQQRIKNIGSGPTSK